MCLLLAFSRGVVGVGCQLIEQAVDVATVALSVCVAVLHVRNGQEEKENASPDKASSRVSSLPLSLCTRPCPSVRFRAAHPPSNAAPLPLPLLSFLHESPCPLGLRALAPLGQGCASGLSSAVYVGVAAAVIVIVFPLLLAFTSPPLHRRGGEEEEGAPQQMIARPTSPSHPPDGVVLRFLSVSVSVSSSCPCALKRHFFSRTPRRDINGEQLDDRKSKSRCPRVPVVVRACRRNMNTDARAHTRIQHPHLFLSASSTTYLW